MVWVCPLCRANNLSVRNSCAVCGAGRFHEKPAEFAPWEDHPVCLDPGALLRRGYVEIHRIFSGGRERYLLRDRDSRECILGLEQLLCLGIMQIRRREDTHGQANSA